jgi:hypothetical protein
VPALVSGQTLSFGNSIAQKEFAQDITLLATPVT